MAENKHLMALKRSQMASRRNKFLGQLEDCNLACCNLIGNQKAIPGQTNLVWYCKVGRNTWRWMALQTSRSCATFSFKGSHIYTMPYLATHLYNNNMAIFMKQQKKNTDLFAKMFLLPQMTFWKEIFLLSHLFRSVFPKVFLYFSIFDLGFRA